MNIELQLREYVSATHEFQYTEMDALSGETVSLLIISDHLNLRTRRYD